MNLLFMCLILFSVSLTALRLYVHFSYGEKLKNDNCLCSENWKRDIFQYGPFYFMFIVIVLSNIVLINSNLKIYMKYLFRFCSIVLATIYLSYIYDIITLRKYMKKKMANHIICAGNIGSSMDLNLILIQILKHLRYQN